MLSWFYYLTGIKDVYFYNFWSGFFPVILLSSGLVTFYKHHKCATCPRIAHHPVQNTHLKTCHKHATIEDHDKLETEHKKRYPKQHKLMRRTK